MTRSSRQNFWFAAAWTFLVIIVSLGFWITLELVRDNKELAERLAVSATRISEQRKQDMAAICQLTIELNPNQEDEVIQAFAEVGVPCGT
jgi:hypothetical protein